MFKALSILLLMCIATPLGAHARDADGSRMQASEVALGKSVSDSLSPPRDSVDWRYFRLKSGSDVSIEVSGSRDVRVKIQLTTATGKMVAETTTAEGKGRLSQKLDPGLYYVSVSAPAATEYKLTIR
jgi:hypothetical protein